MNIVFMCGQTRPANEITKISKRKEISHPINEFFHILLAKKKSEYVEEKKNNKSADFDEVSWFQMNITFFFINNFYFFFV